MSIEIMKLALEAIQDLRGYRPDIDSAIETLRAALSQQPATGVTVGYMNAGNIHELKQGALPYGYVYPQKESGVSVPVYAHPAPSVPDVDFELQELREIERAMDDFADCGETDVVDTLLLRAVQAGFLECTHFHAANRGALQEAIDAAMLAAKEGGST